ncbi:hypothetical protein PEX1_049610 [Penicillium expansum]|uniref:Uncharacterized protein n=1 Tax=Penicillium expansum TaxID=27334 RepID=A0A0A2JT44_PENEN|nr:hypothetical protein PEX2_109120 [Penicillium expansum]KGO47174.1 hypothetical protein PEXP_063280 [Penicillium expansum]KGO52260.1 hypothetical protein PEX2_109120 [Penicillium expansum]KGO58011.1 hypothetical protein PEX1_049610 [Penicillium expansum]
MPSREPTIRPQGHSTPRHRESACDNDRELYLQICTPGPDGAIHWMIIEKLPRSDRCTRLHSTGYKGNRKLAIEHGKRFESRSVEHTHYLGKFHSSYSALIKREASKIPLQSCQLWACYLMLRLERKGLLEVGKFDHYWNSYEHNFDEHYGEGEDDDACPIHGHDDARRIHRHDDARPIHRHDDACPIHRHDDACPIHRR